MSERESWIDALQHDARFVYGEAGDAVADALITRAERFREEHPRSSVAPTSRMSERDAILISYADSIRDPSEAPLRTLRRWLEGPLADTVSTVHVLPFYPWSSDDGFSVCDYRSVAPEYGTWEDVEALAADRRLMVDAVINHASAQGTWFQQFLRGEAPQKDWFRTEDEDADVRSIVRPRTSPLLTPFDAASGRTWAWTTFGPDQVDLDYREPTLLLEIADVVLGYVGHGADVLRMDAITYLWKELGTPSVHHPKTHALIRILRAVLELAAPGVIVLTETNVPHDENVSYFGRGDDEAQMVYNFALPPLLLHTIASGDASVLRAWADELRTPSDSSWFLNFLASHDGIGLRAVEAWLPRAAVDALAARARAQGGAVGFKRDSDGGESPYELNVNYFDALRQPGVEEPLGRQVARFATVHAVAMALPGVPALYVHSLLGSIGDPELMAERGIARAINRAKLDSDELSRELADGEGRRARVLTALRRLLTVRRAHAAFHPSAPAEIGDAPRGVFAIRRGEGDTTVHAWHELSGDATEVVVPVAGTDLLLGTPVPSGPVRLAPYQTLWLRPDGAAD